MHGRTLAKWMAIDARVWFAVIQPALSFSFAAMQQCSNAAVHCVVAVTVLYGGKFRSIVPF
jgi:hypothetical protein